MKRLIFLFPILFTLVANGQYYKITHFGSVDVVACSDCTPPGSYDADANAFFTATGITDNNIKCAVNQLVLDLKSAGIWSKIVALWPIAGGNATAHAINLKNPSSYPLTFVGGPTHSASGVDYNGSTQYIQTGFVPSTGLSSDNAFYALYNGDDTPNAGGSGDDFSSLLESHTNVVWMATSYTDGSLYAEAYNANSGGGRVSQPYSTNPQWQDSRGLWTITRTASNDLRWFRNTTQAGSTATGSGGTRPSSQIYVAARHGSGGAASDFSSRETRLICFGNDGLTPTENTAWNTAVQNYQCRMGRKVNN